MQTLISALLTVAVHGLMNGRHRYAVLHDGVIMLADVGGTRQAARLYLRSTCNWLRLVLCIWDQEPHLPTQHTCL